MLSGEKFLSLASIRINNPSTNSGEKCVLSL
jgi:hypothetical protein